MTQHNHELSYAWESALALLGAAIDDAHGINPGDNSAECFECPTFQMAAYDWSDGPDARDWNFRWRDVEISWYKYMGRGMMANKPLTNKQALDMIAECLPAAYGENLAT